MNILPNRFIGVIGEHEFDVEGMTLTHDRSLLASCSHDQVIKFWDVSNIGSVKVNVKKKAKKANKTKRIGTAKKKNDFFAGLADMDGPGDGGDGGSDDDDEDSCGDADSDDSDSD